MMYSDDDLEKRILSEIQEKLPDWHIDSESLNKSQRRYDIVVSSPARNVFPIEIETGPGRLDLTSVVEFGANVKRDLQLEVNGVRAFDPVIDTTEKTPRKLEIADYEQPAIDPSKVVPAQAEFVKPLLVTNKPSSIASNEYADTFLVEIVSSSQAAIASELTPSDDVGNFVVNRLRSLDESIAKYHKEAEPLVDTTSENKWSEPLVEEDAQGERWWRIERGKP